MQVKKKIKKKKINKEANEKVIKTPKEEAKMDCVQLTSKFLKIII